MGVLLREALRSICVNNQWSYAVFWKIGCQNSSLLIWEECYNETSLSGHDTDTQKVQLLTNRMMLNNRIILVGEGLVGRAAFTGHHQWILADSFNRVGVHHPPEVINEMLLQFSAGIQTVAVFPVVPHGVVQLGSSLPIMENLGFVNDVKGLIMQLGCVPGALLSESYTTSYEPPAADFIGVPVSGLMPSQGHKILQSSAFLPETSKPHFNSIASSSDHHQTFEEASCNHLVDEHLKQGGGWQNTTSFLAGPPPSNPDAWLNQNLSCMSNVEQQTPCEDSSSKRSDDLFDMLGLDDRNRGCENSWELSDFRIIQEMGSSALSGGTEDHLLDAVVSGACSYSTKQISSDETSESCKTTVTKVSNSSVATTPPSHQNSPPQGLYEKKHVAVGPSSLLYGSQISSWVEQAHSLKREGSQRVVMNKNETAKPASNRKKLKPGENPRPRPKDRQMIQDRVKELREIIPNSAKCSIDALLERTIKHMLFLQNVSKHADKVKQTGESKIVKDEGGATWAFEVGSKSLMCPIVVEDISPPRIFQVEMLCEQRGFFLEIADWIRSLGLTILKGVIETRVDKIWARFTVEASRDVTRMEIFMQLVNILEQTMKCGGNSKSILDGIKATMPISNTLPVTTGGCSM